MYKLTNIKFGQALDELLAELRLPQKHRVTPGRSSLAGPVRRCVSRRAARQEDPGVGRPACKYQLEADGPSLR
jgi:hypothetical protein